MNADDTAQIVSAAAEAARYARAYRCSIDVVIGRSFLRPPIEVHVQPLSPLSAGAADPFTEEDRAHLIAAGQKPGTVESDTEVLTESDAG